MRRADLAAVAVAALLIYAFATRQGMSVWPDTVSYMDMAAAIREGRDPGPNFPPLFPLMLALFQSARVINGVCFVLSAVLVTIAVWRQSNHRWAALAAGSLAMTAPPVLVIGTSAQSEPLYITLVLAGLLTSSGLLVGLACATRYAGLPMLLLGAARNRTLAYLIPAALPLAAIIVKNWLRSGAATNREMHVRLPSIDLLVEGATNVTRWLVPLFHQTPLRYAVAGAVIGLLARNWRNVFAQAALAHVAFVWISQALLDAAIVFDDRLLLPFFYLALPACAVAAARDRRATLAFAGLALLSLVRCVHWFATDDFNRLFFNAPRHQVSEALRFVRELPPDVLVVSNADDLIRYQTGRAAVRLPDAVGFTTALPRPQWCEELKAVTAGRDVWVVWLEFGENRDHLPQPDALPGCLNLEPPRRFADGQAFRLVQTTKNRAATLLPKPRRDREGADIALD